MHNLRGFYDLCINRDLFASEKFNNTVKTLRNFGYRTVAVNYIIEEESPQGSTSKSKKRKGEAPKTDLLPQILQFANHEQQDGIRIFHRITIHLYSKDFFVKISKQPEFKQFDIIAITPLNLDAFNFVCVDCPADILAMSRNQKFPLQRKHYKQLVSRNVYLELPYSSLLNDDTSRKLLISLSHDFHMAGKSRNVILSSGANKLSDIRNAYDVVNMGLILGLGQAQSKSALLQHGRSVCMNAISRRYGKIAIIARNTQNTQQDPHEEDDIIVIDDSYNSPIETRHVIKKLKT